MFNITPDQAKEKFTTLSYKGKKLIADIFGRAEFIYIAEIQADQTVNLSGLLKTRRKEIPIEEVDLIFEGPPAGFIKDASLHFIGSDMTYRELKRLPCTISQKEFKEIQEEEVEILIFGEEKVEKKVSRLILQDPFGITAILPDPNDAQELLITDYTRSGQGWSCRSDKVFESLSLLKAGGWKIETTKGEEVLLFEKMDLDWTPIEDKLQLTGTFTFEHETISIESVNEGRQVSLGNHKVGLLPDHFKLGTFTKTPVSKLKVGLIHDLVGDAVFTRKNDLFIPKSEQDPSKNFNGTLRSYQKEGLSWLYFLYQNGFSGFLADDMGLGKTIQTLAFLSLLPKNSPILIVLPTSLKFNWKNEIQRFLPDKLGDITLVSYHELRANPLAYTALIWDVVILDEAQAIKNADTQTFKAVKQLQSRFRLSISGTPIENRLEELFTHFKFLLPELDLTGSPSILRKLTAPFILRRTKEKVLKELPEKIETTIQVELFADEQEIYDRFLSDGKQEGFDKQNQIQILEFILRLRQIACHPKLAGFSVEDSSKLKLVLSDLESLVSEGRKVLVFSQFTSFLNIVSQELKELNLPFLLFTGETKNREAVVNTFQNEEGPPILLMSLKAGGVGLNLTAADTVLILDPWWNEAAEEQAIARAHRIGQKKTLFVKRYLSKGTIEEKVALLKAHKKNLANEVIGEGLEESGYKLEDLLGLLS